MSLFLRRSFQHSQNDYSVMYREDADGREIRVGRIMRDWGMTDGSLRWFWVVEFHQAMTRPQPHQGRAETFEEAKVAWRGSWNSADVPIHWPPSLRNR